MGMTTKQDHYFNFRVGDFTGTIEHPDKEKAHEATVKVHELLRTLYHPEVQKVEEEE